MDKQNCALNNESVQMLTLILSENQCHKCARLAKEQGITGGIVLIGKGTVSSMVLNMLGIKNQKKEIIKLLVRKENAREVLDYFNETLQLNKPGHGIAYITPVISVVGLPKQGTAHEKIASEAVQKTEGEYMFKKLTVIVDRGMANDVMDIARNAGVRGGTILHGRGVGSEVETNLFGVEIEPEKELVIILTPNELVDKVVNALTEEFHLDEPGKGILFIEPVEDTRGLVELSEK
ncbi:MAG: P-II family nitrogen regulator [Clostridiaceae bacterium]|nr:P-II family nitrogen regulator [Clostridiaceae bacterium]